MPAPIVQKLPGEPILVLTLPQGYVLGAQTPETMNRIKGQLDQFDTPIYFIVDQRAVHLDLQGLIETMNLLSRGDDALLKHPKIREVLLVQTDELGRMAAEGLSDDIFGSFKIDIFNTPEDALTYARSKIG